MIAKDDTFQVIEMKLAPGEFYFGGGYTRIHTLLGSCIAITLWHPQKHIGGMCHYLLPSRGINQRLTQGYFADESVMMFLNAVKKVGTRPADYEVKVFGGGNMFETLGYTSGLPNVPQNNISAGTALLQAHGFKIKSTDVGGVVHRKIFLELWNGDVWVQRGPSVKREYHP